jgi:hypothetical protein
MLVARVYTIPHTKCLKRAFCRNFGGLLDFLYGMSKGLLILVRPR